MACTSARRVYVVRSVRRRKISVRKSSGTRSYLPKGRFSHTGRRFFFLSGPSGLVSSLCRADELPNISTGHTYAKRVNTINTTTNRTRATRTPCQVIFVSAFSLFFVPSIPHHPPAERVYGSRVFTVFFSRLYSGPSASNRIPRTYHTAMGLCTCAKPRRIRRTIRVRPHIYICFIYISVL